MLPFCKSPRFSIKHRLPFLKVIDFLLKNVALFIKIRFFIKIIIFFTNCIHKMLPFRIVYTKYSAFCKKINQFYRKCRPFRKDQRFSKENVALFLKAYDFLKNVSSFVKIIDFSKENVASLLKAYDFLKKCVLFRKDQRFFK